MHSFGIFVGVGQRDAAFTGNSPDNVAMSISASDADELAYAFEICPTPLNNQQVSQGSSVIRLLNQNATKEEISQQLEQIADKGKTDLVVFYFSGHGSMVGNEHYLLCRNTYNNNIKESGLSGNWLLNMLKKIDCNRMLVVLDCCHSGGVTPIDVPFDQHAFDENKNRVIITACHKSQVSYLSNPVSLFTYAFIEGLAGDCLGVDDKAINVFDLAMYARERVIWLSDKNQIAEYKVAQQPQLILFPQSRSENFMLAEYSKKPSKTYFREKVQKLTGENGKSILLDPGIIADKDYRQKFLWLINQKGDNNLVIIGDNNQTNQTSIGYVIQADTVIFGGNQDSNSNKPQTVLPKIDIKTSYAPKWEGKIPDKRPLKNFVITINSVDDIKLSQVDAEERKELENLMGELLPDKSISDQLCESTISYCYETIRGSGENLRSNTRNNLSSLIGNYLFKILLRNEQGERLIHAFNENDKKPNHEKEDIRLFLKFGENQDIARLLLWPWEYLHYTDEKNNKLKYFLLSKIKIQRIFSTEKATQRMPKARSEKLKVLVFFSPENKEFDNSHIEKLKKSFTALEEYYSYDEKSNNDSTIQRKSFEFLLLHPPLSQENTPPKSTYSSFASTISSFNPNVIHFIGEAQMKEKEVFLNFWSKRGNENVSEPLNLSDEFYGDMENFIRNNQQLQLCIFHSWNNIDDIAYKAFNSIAHELIERGMPAVLSIPSGFHVSGSSSMDDYLEALKSFYEILTEGFPLSDALFELRKLAVKAGKGFPLLYLYNTMSDQFRVEKLSTPELPTNRNLTGEENRGPEQKDLIDSQFQRQDRYRDLINPKPDVSGTKV